MEHKESNESIRLKMLDEIADIEAFSKGPRGGRPDSGQNVAKSRGYEPHQYWELSKAFTEDYIAAMPEIPWKAIRGFRNIAAHQYGIIDFDDVYKTVTEDIPSLKAALQAQGE